MYYLASIVLDQNGLDLASLGLITLLTVNCEFSKLICN